MQALIFDLDNTLVNSEAAYKTCLTTLGVDFDRYEVARLEVKNRYKFFKNAVQARNRLLYFKQYLELGLNQFSAHQILKLYKDYEDLLVQNFKEQWFQLKRDDLFENLAGRYDLYILTNENLRTQLAKISAFEGQRSYFKGIITSEEFGVEKPDLEIFRYIINTYKLTPKSTVMIGDDFECDIKPAEALGLCTIQTTEFIKNEKTPITSNANRHFIIDDLNKVLEFPLFKLKN